MTIRRIVLSAAVAAGLSGCATQTTTPTSAPASTSRASTTTTHRERTSATPTTHARGTVSHQPAALGLITEPAAGVAPILNAISDAHHRVDLVMYELEDPRVEAALAAAHARGVAVRVLLNGGYYGEGSSQNQAAYQYLSAHHVPVRWSPKDFALTHQKTLVVDDRADILTFNLTPEYYGSSRDFGVVDPNPRDVTAIETTFNADWDDQHIAAPSGSGDLIWSPGSEGAQLAAINAATSGAPLDIYNEEMDDTSVERALAAAARRGVDVRVVMTASSDWDQAFAQLTAVGAHVRTYAPDASLYIHAKMLLTPTHGILESENFSTTSLDRNRELGITFTTKRLIPSLRRTFNDDYAHATPFAAPRPTTSSGTSCTVAPGTSYSSHYKDWTVIVHSDQDDQTVTVSDNAGHSSSWHTSSDGHASVYFKAPSTAAGEAITVRVGTSVCHGTL